MCTCALKIRLFFLQKKLVKRMLSCSSNLFTSSLQAPLITLQFSPFFRPTRRRHPPRQKLRFYCEASRNSGVDSAASIWRVGSARIKRLVFLSFQINPQQQLRARFYFVRRRAILIVNFLHCCCMWLTALCTPTVQQIK